MSAAQETPPLKLHPLALTIAERARISNDSALETWAKDVLTPLIIQEALTPAKGFTKRESKLLPQLAHLNIEKMQTMRAQNISAHILAGLLPIADLMQILKVDAPLRRLVLATFTLHDASKSAHELRTTERNRERPEQTERFNALLWELASRWGMQQLIEEIARDLNTDRSGALSALSWTGSNTETGRGREISPADHHIPEEVWRRHSSTLHLARSFSQLGDLIASLSNEGLNATQLIRERRIQTLLNDVLAGCDQAGAYTLKAWNVHRVRTMTTPLILEGIQNALRAQGAHPWLVSSSGGVALLPAGQQMPSREVLEASIKQTFVTFIEKKIEGKKRSGKQAELLSGNLPQEKRASAALLMTATSETFPELIETIFDACKRSYNPKKRADYNSFVTVATANACLALLRSTGLELATYDAGVVQLLAQGSENEGDWSERWSADLSLDTKQPSYGHLKARIGTWYTQAGLDTESLAVAECIVRGTKKLITGQNLPESIIKIALSETIDQNLSVSGEAREKIRQLLEKKQVESAKDKKALRACFSCGEIRKAVPSDLMKGAASVSGYNARLKPGFNKPESLLCHSCLLEEVLLQLQDSNRDSSRGDAYVHVTLPGFASALEAAGLQRLSGFLRLTQPWHLLPHRQDMSSSQELINFLMEQHALWEVPGSITEKHVAADTQDETADENDAIPDEFEDDVEFLTTQEKSRIKEGQKSAFARQAVFPMIPGMPPTHWSVRIHNSDGRAPLEALALGLTTAMLIPGTQVSITNDAQIPDSFNNAQVLNMGLNSSIWRNWSMGEQAFGLQELPLVLQHLMGIFKIAQIRDSKVPANEMLAAAMISNSNPIALTSTRLLRSNTTPENYEKALIAQSVRQRYQVQMDQPQGDSMKHIQKTVEAMNNFRWENDDSDSAHSRTRPLKVALDTLTKRAQPNSSFEERQDARDLATGTVARMLKNDWDAPKVVAFIEIIDQELLQGLCQGDINRLRNMTNEIIQATDAIKLTARSKRAEAKKEAAQAHHTENETQTQTE